MKLILAFALVALGMILPSAFASTAQIEVNGASHDVQYEATGLSVDGLEADTTTATLSVLVTVTDPEGTLTITLDRSFFDSKTNGEDDDFFVLLDGGQDVTPVEEKTDTARTLTITVPSGTNSIDIIGTEFGSGEPAPETPSETPVEEPAPETPSETPTEPEPAMQCGPGTVLDSNTNTCVVITAEPAPTEEPAPETPAETPQETPEQQCGPGTVLKDGQCVLDETCGAGTILKDGQCVLDTSTPAPVSGSGGSQFVIALIAGFIIAFVIMIILWAIGKAGRSKN